MLYYKLDPGEIGLASPARASESILRVSAHEIANIRRFEAEAALKGGIVVYKNVSLDIAFEGSFLAARAGKSEARVIYRKSGNRIVIERFNELDREKEEIKLRLERERDLLEQRKRAVRRDPTLDLSQKEFRIRNLDRRIREIERLMILLDMRIETPLTRAMFLNLIA